MFSDSYIYNLQTNEVALFWHDLIQFLSSMYVHTVYLSFHILSQYDALL